MFGLFTQRCQQCSNILKRKKFKWRVDGRTKWVCPACNSTMQRKASSASFKESHSGHASSGFNSFAKVVLLLVLALSFVGFYTSRTKKPETPSEPLRADYPKTDAELKIQAPPKEKSMPRPREVQLSLEGVTLPATLTVMKEFNLLNATGQETPIPVNALIKVTQRSGTGTLSMEINGAFFVGNESRLSGKVKMP